MLNWTRIKFAGGFLTAALMAGTAFASTVSSNSISTLLPAVSRAKQVMIGTLFLKVPTTNADEVVNEVTNSPVLLMNPNSPKFRDFLKAHPEVKLLGAPRILTAPGKAAKMSMTMPSTMAAANPGAGITLNVLSLVGADSIITSKIGYELRESLPASATSLQVTTNEQTLTFQLPRNPLLIRQDISSDGADTVLVFVRALLVQQRFQSILKHSP